MKIISISREFGSGGREIGKELADLLHIDYYDKEILKKMSEATNLDANYIENKLENKNMFMSGLTYARSFSFTYDNSIDILLTEKKVIEEIAKLGRDCVIVGRNADVYLNNENVFSIFITASMDVKIKRCMDRRSEDEMKLTEKDMKNKIINIDKNRKRIRELIGGTPWGDKLSYDMIINSTWIKNSVIAHGLVKFLKPWIDGNSYEDTNI